MAPPAEVASNPVTVRLLSGSLSLVSRPPAATVRTASSVVAPVSSAATGASFTPVTVTVTVAVSVTVPSETV